jgi:putative hemin transport protein
MSPTLLKHRLDNLKEENPKARLIDIARSMNITELEALHCQVDHQTVFALRPDWLRLFNELPQLGRVMALTRNEYVVHECKGQYGPATWRGPTGLIHNDTIDLRMFSASWKYLYAVQVKNPRGLLQSFQIFDGHGRAVHKIFLEASADSYAYWTLVHELEMYNPESPEVTRQASVEAPASVDVDAAAVASFRRDWAKLQDTHEFFRLLKKYQLPRLQALEIAGSDFVREVDPKAVLWILEIARDQNEALMAFVGNPGMIQIYSGKMQQIKRIGDWINVLDPDFNLHVHEKGLDRAFVVHKPTRYGSVSSLEVFCRQGELILSLFGCRGDDQQQNPAWADMLATLEAI